MITNLEDLASIASNTKHLISQLHLLHERRSPDPISSATSPSPHSTAHSPLPTPAPIVSLYSFKGGVGKSTLSVHAAHYFALRGYKVLLADYDPQGSATAYHFTEHAPIDRAALANRAYLLGDEHSIETAIIPTHIPNLHLIPATIRLHDCDIALSLDLAQVTNQRLYRMKRGIHHLARHYDLIFIDGPPALASIGLSILATATVLLIPMHPSMIDCASTGHLLHVLLSYTHSASIELGPTTSSR